MKKQIKTLIIAASVLLVLIGAVLVLAAISDGKEGAESASSERESYSVISEKTSNLEKIVINNSFGEYTIERDEENNLTLPGFEKYPLSAANLTLVSNGLSMFSSNDKIASPEDLSVYGLSSPSATATAYFKNGKQYTVKVGKKSEYSENLGYYALVEGDENVYVLNPSASELLMCDKMQYISLVLSNTTEEEVLPLVEKAEFSGSGVTPFKLEKAKITTDGITYSDTLKLSDPYDIFVDSEKAETVFTAMLNMHASVVEKLSPAEEDLSRYGLKNALAVLDITYKESKKLKIRLGNKTEDGCYYIMNDEYDVVYKISADNISNWVGLKPASVMMTLPVYTPIYVLNELHVTYDGKTYIYDIDADPSLKSQIEVSLRGEGKIDVDNFKKFYAKTMLYAVTDTMTEIPSSAKDFSLTYVYDNGKADTVDFYDMGSRRYQVLKNGKGRFITTYTEVKTLKDTFGKLIKGEPIAEVNG
jgi:hypothetical protein